MLDSPPSPHQASAATNSLDDRTPTPNKFAPALGRVLDSPTSPAVMPSNGNAGKSFGPQVGRVLDSPAPENGAVRAANKFAPALGRVLGSPSSPSPSANGVSSPTHTPIVKQTPDRAVDSPVSYSESPVPIKKPPTFSSVSAPKSRVLDAPSVAQQQSSVAPVSYSPIGSPYNGISANRFDAVAPTVAFDALHINAAQKASDGNNDRWVEKIRSASPKPEVHSYDAGEKKWDLENSYYMQ